MFLQIMFRQPPGEAKITANRLANALAVEGAGQGIDDAVGNGSVVFVTEIVGCDIVVAFLQHWPGQQLDPLRRDASEI